MASLLQYADIDEMKRAMTQRSYLGWLRYWDVEPWGPWRDNVHTAVLAREIRRAQVRSGTRIDLEQFMVRHPSERQRKGETDLFSVMQAVATPVTPEEARKRRRAASRKRSRRDDRSSEASRST